MSDSKRYRELCTQLLQHCQRCSITANELVELRLALFHANRFAISLHDEYGEMEINRLEDGEIDQSNTLGLLNRIRILQSKFKDISTRPACRSSNI